MFHSSKKHYGKLSELVSLVRLILSLHDRTFHIILSNKSTIGGILALPIGSASLDDICLVFFV